MPIRPELLLRDLEGRPLPSPELLERLRRYDPRLGLYYTKAAWAITETWRDDDKRRAWIQDGSVPPHMAFDICGYLPLTCSLDEAPAYIERELRGYNPEQYAALREAVAHWNDVEQPKLVEEQVRAGIEEDMTKSGPSLGIVNVPAQIVDNTVPPPAVAPAPAPKRRVLKRVPKRKGS